MIRLSYHINSIYNLVNFRLSNNGPNITQNWDPLVIYKTLGITPPACEAKPRYQGKYNIPPVTPRVKPRKRNSFKSSHSGQLDRPLLFLKTYAPARMPTYMGKFQVFRKAMLPASQARIPKNRGEISSGMMPSHRKDSLFGRRYSSRAKFTIRNTNGRDST